MNKLFAFILLSLVFASSFAKSLDIPTFPKVGQDSSLNTLEGISFRVLMLLGQPANFSFREGTVSSVLAVVEGEGETEKRWIIYNPVFFGIFSDSMRWAAVGIVAREIAHHLYEHSLPLVENAVTEEMRKGIYDETVDADFLSGYVMARLGADYNMVMSALTLILPPTKENEDAFPMRRDRVRAFTRGYEYASTLLKALTDDDIDKDGIRDSKDPCPREKGLLGRGGCPILLKGIPAYTDNVQVDTLPKALNTKEVWKIMGYPSKFIFGANKGEVTLKILIDEKGNYLQNRVIKQDNVKLLQIIESHIYLLKFSPAWKDGKAIKYWAEIKWKF